MPTKLQIIIAGTLFALLLAPLGQQPYLLEHWMHIGAFGALFLMLGMLVARQAPGPLSSDLRFLSAALFAAYLVHQFEEHGVDLKGRRFWFMVDANASLGPLVGCGGGLCPFNPKNIFYINIISVWFMMVGSLIFNGPRFLFARICSASLLLTNAVAHIVVGILRWSYNPGLLTSIVLFVPLSLYFYREVALQFHLERKFLLLGVAWGVLAHAVLGLVTIAVYVKHLLPEFMHPIPLMLWAVAPFLVNAGAKLRAVREE